MNLSGKAALITGGARIGQAVALELARRGCAVAMSYRTSRSAAHSTVRAIRGEGSLAVAFKCDVTSDRDVSSLVDKTRMEFGRLDIVINMASIYERTPLRKLTRADWDRNLAANLTAAHLVTMKALPYLQKNRGRVVHIADWVAASGRPRYRDFLPYYTAKSGLVGLTQAQALEFAPRVLVNAIAPGPILPPKGISNDEVRGIEKVTPLGRWGGASEIAKAVVFLCETDFITGECVRVDGGRHLL